MGETIATSKRAYLTILEKKREIEKERGKVASMADALDKLLIEKGAKNNK